MTKFATLVSESQFALWIRGNAALDTFELLDLAPGSLDAVAAREYFVGVVGFSSGFVPRVALSKPLDDRSTKILTRAITALVEAAITRIAQSIKTC